MAGLGGAGLGRGGLGAGVVGLDGKVSAVATQG